MVAGDLVSEPEESFQLTRETYLSRRLAQNPSWYPWVTANDNEMRTVVETSLLRMASIGLLRIQASSSAVLTLEPTTLGKLACFFSLRPIFFERINNLLSEMNQEKREQKAHDLAHEDHACMPDSCKVEESLLSENRAGRHQQDSARTHIRIGTTCFLPGYQIGLLRIFCCD
jgi:hypothetical protein